MKNKLELERLGYKLERVSRDFLGKPCKYRTVPIGTGGTTNYFEQRKYVEDYISNLKRVRKIYETV